jgi:hypothetical protein
MRASRCIDERLADQRRMPLPDCQRQHCRRVRGFACGQITIDHDHAALWPRKYIGHLVPRSFIQASILR